MIITEYEDLLISDIIESPSEHPIARGILASAEDRGIAVPPADGFRAIAGTGVTARIDGVEYHVGGPALIALRSAVVPDALSSKIEEAASRGQSAIGLIRDEDALAVFVIADAVREESLEAVQIGRASCRERV